MQIKRLLFFGILLMPFLFVSNKVNGQNNILEDRDCTSTKAPFGFEVQPLWMSETGYGIDNRFTPLAGDIDGDGKVEVIVMGSNQKSIYIFDGENGKKIGEAVTNYTSYHECEGGSILIYRSAPGAPGAIFVPSYNSKSMTLFEVTSEPGERPIVFGEKWKKTSVPFVTPVGTNNLLGMPIVSDFDGDGKAEFFVNGCFIDPENGDILESIPQLGVGGWRISFPLAADLDGDGKTELAVGTCVYKFDRSQPAGSRTTLWRTCPGLPEQEGYNMVADVDQDGSVDLVYHNAFDHSGPGFVRVWNPVSNTIIGDIENIGTSYRSYPFVGDIDGVDNGGGKKYPEICVNTPNKLYAFYYTGSGFETKWIMTHSDGSGSTALTLFDFNVDGTVELIYRDETSIKIFDGSGSSIGTALGSFPASSGTLNETPIVADVTGSGSANMLVTTGSQVAAYEGITSKWAACPGVWNQQLYSPLLVNLDLTIPATVKSADLEFTQICVQPNKKIQYYNGGPMQVPFIGKTTLCPIDISPDVYVVSGNITISGSTVTIEVTFGNQGMALAPASMPIRFYKNSMTPANILAEANTTLGVDLRVGQTHTITKTITGLSPMPSQFYVRILDDGVSFPAVGPYSDCNYTNNTKSFGTLELTKVVTSLSACMGTSSIFTVKVVNNQTVTLNNIVLTDSLAPGWDFVSATPLKGTIGAYNTATRKLGWTVPTLAPGDSAKLTLKARSSLPGTIRNTAWIESVGGVAVGRESIEAYVVVDNQQPPAAPSWVSVGPVRLCPPATSVTLSVTASGTNFQWYRDDVLIPGATLSTYDATQTGSYTVTVHNGTCLSDASSAISVTDDCATITAYDDYINIFACNQTVVDVLANDAITGGVTGTAVTIVAAPVYGTASTSAGKINYNANGGSLANCADAGGLIDSFKYKVCKDGICDEAIVTVNILRVPFIVLKDSCSSLPRLVLSHQYEGAFYDWEYSDDAGANWTSLETNTNKPEYYATKPGQYRVTIHYNGQSVQTVSTFIVHKKAKLPGNRWWYEAELQ